MRQLLLIMLLAITAIIVNVSPGGCTNVAIAIITIILLAASATLMELQK